MNSTTMDANYTARTAVRAERYQRFLQLRLSLVYGVILDLDGTMVDTAPDFHEAVNRMRADFGLAPLDLRSVSDCIGKGSEHLVRATLQQGWDLERAEAHFDAALQAYQRHYHAINGEQAQVYPGVREGLTRMRGAGLTLACVTNKPYALAVPLLEQTGLAPFFSIVYGGDSLPHKKPHPLPLQRVCEEWNLLPEQVLLIGDSSNDVKAAHAAGCPVLNVPYGYNHGQPIGLAGADLVVADLVAAADLLAA